MPSWFEYRDKTTNEYIPYHPDIDPDQVNIVENYAESYPVGCTFTREGFIRGEVEDYGRDIAGYKTTWRLACKN